MPPVALPWRFCTAWCVLLKNPCKTYAKSSVNFPQRAFFLAKNQVEWEKKLCRTKSAAKGCFCCCALPSQGPAQGWRFASQCRCGRKSRRRCRTQRNWQRTQVELNTADADALCTLPGVGPRNAQAILDYRAQYGPFAQVKDAAQVPGITQAMVDSWAGQAYVR